ncbi:hypothetical protein PTTG_10455, partial [Puccinia triticina 1-1 BBBD Race 1]
ILFLLLVASFFHTPFSSGRKANRKGATLSGRSSLLLNTDITQDNGPNSLSSGDLAHYLSATTGPSTRSPFAGSPLLARGDSPLTAVNSVVKTTTSTAGSSPRHPKSLQLYQLKKCTVSLARRHTSTYKVLEKPPRSSR